MSENTVASRESISVYRLMGWIPLLVTGIGATSVVIFSVLRDI